MNNRQKFEEWFKREVFSLELANKNLVNCYWDAWEAATDQLEAQVKQLAAERDAVNADNAYLRDQVICWARECDRITFTYTNKVTDAHQMEAEKELANTVPATDAILASLRAEGVDIARNALLEFVEDDVGPNENVPGLIRGAEVCVSIAAQLRSKSEVQS